MKLKKVCVSLLLVFVFLFVNVFQMFGSISTFALDTINGEPSFDSPEYDAWKQRYVSENKIAFLNGISAYAASTSGNKLYNDYIEFAVSNNARYTVGTTGGNPDISTDNYKKLLYGHPSSSTSYTTLRINGTNHIYGSGSFTTNPIIDAQANKNISEQKVGDVRVKQVLTLVKNTATDREDIVEIKYIIKNEGTTSASTGVRIMMDTMLGNNDAAPFRIPGVGEVTYEREYTGDNVPQYWQAFDSMTNPQVVSQGTLLRSSENKPDKVQFTNWRRVYNNAWDYNVSTSSQNGDSAVSVIWEPKNIAPGQEVEYATYYGLSELVQDLKPPLAVSLFGDASVRATQNGYEPNPFVVTVYVQNIGSASASNVKAKINLPTGLKLEGTEAATKTIGSISVNQEKQLSWSVSVDSSNADKTLEYSVDVWSDNTESKNVKKSIFIPRALDKKAIIFIPGITGSEIFTTEAFNSKTFLGKDFDFNYSNDYRLWDPASAAGKNTAQILLDRDRVKTDVRLLVCNESGDAIVPTEAKDLDTTDLHFGATDHYGIIMTRLINEFSSSGYEVDFLPYDWRMDNSIAANNLETLINNKGYSNVILVAHSMGGLVASKYISKSTTNKNKVEKLITMGTPYLGSPKVLHVLETGNFFNDSKDTLMHEPIKFIGNNLSALYQLLPTKKYFSLNNTYYVKKYVEGDWYPGGKKEQNIDLKTYDDTKKLISQRNWALSSNNTVKRFFVDAENFHDSLFDNNSQVVKSVDSYLIIGYDKDTIMKVTEKYKKDGSFKEIRDIIKLNGGDGTVPVTSANIGGTVSSDKTYYIREEHGALPRNNNVIDLVVNIINGNTNTFDQNTLSKTLPTEINEKGWFGSTKTRRVEVKVECPVRLEIYDEINNFVGTADDEYIINSTSDYGTFDTYGENNDKKMAYLQDGVYNVKLVGKSLGLMNLSIKLQDAGYDIKTILFNDVPVTETTVFTTNTDFSSNILLYVDSNNDGIIDNTINPTDIIKGDISSDNIAPNIISTITGSQGKNGWYISDIKYDLSASDNLGVKDIEYIFKNESNPHLFGEIIEIVDEGTSEIYATAVDYNNNRSIILNDVIHVDKSAPTIDINIEEGSEFLLNQKVGFTYSAFDEVSGIESVSSSIENNSQIDTSTVGEKTITVIATDFAGNQSIKTIKYKVKYSFEGIIKPINSDGSSVFKFGRAIPVKFQLKDYAGNNSSIANAKLYLEKIADLGTGTFIEAVSSGNSNTDNIFRYDNKDEQYIFNLNTSNMSVGTWKLKIILDDHSEYDIEISLK